MLTLNTLREDPYQLLIIPAALLAVMLHEVSHGLAAYWSGDLTAKQSGRLTLNPIRHLDVLGLISMIFFGFGWAKPVPVDMRYFKKPRRDFALVALAGPLSNFLQALAGLLLLNLCLLSAQTGTFDFLYIFLYYYVLLNVGLGVFNLFPIPPLDGSKIIGIIIPDRYYYRILRYERYGMILLVVLLFTGVLDGPLGFLRNQVMQGIGWLAGLPFRGVFL